MLVKFTGSPEKIVRQMRAFLAAYPAERVNENNTPPHAAADDTPLTTPVPVVTKVENLPGVPPGEAGPLHSGESVCQFCAKYTGIAGWVGRHEKHCKSNPNRIPHPMEGRVNPGLQAFVNARKKSLQSENDNSATKEDAASSPENARTEMDSEKSIPETSKGEVQ